MLKNTKTTIKIPIENKFPRKKTGLLLCLVTAVLVVSGAGELFIKAYALQNPAIPLGTQLFCIIAENGL